MAVFKVRWHFSSGNAARSELLYWNGTSLSACVDDTIALSVKRLKFLANNWCLDAVSIAGGGLASESDPMKPPFSRRAKRRLCAEVAGCGDPNIPRAVCPDSVMMVRLFDETARWGRSFWVTGVPLLPWASDFETGDSAMPAPVPMLMREWLAEMGARDLGVAAGSAPTAKPWSLLRRGRAVGDLAVPRIPVTHVAVQALTDLWQITVPASSGLKIGQKIHLHLFKGCTLKGLAGDVTIKAITAGGGFEAGDLLTLQKRQCCKGPIVYDQRGTYYPLYSHFDFIKRFSIARPSVRRNGQARDFKPGKSRSSGCCA